MAGGMAARYAHSLTGWTLGIVTRLSEAKKSGNIYLTNFNTDGCKPGSNPEGRNAESVPERGKQ